MRRLIPNEMVVVNDSVPNPIYQGRVGLFIGCWGDPERQRNQRLWVVRFPEPYGLLSLSVNFRRTEIDALDEITDEESS